MKSIFGSLSLLFLFTLNSVSEADEKVVICYYGTWASYRTGLGKFEVTDVPTGLCTHIVYTFVGIDYSGTVQSLDLDYEENWGKGYLKKFNDLKKINPKLKIILAVGGFNEGSEKYSLMAANPTLRKNFINSAMAMVDQYGFDGFEVDWEYPNRGTSVYGTEDITNFTRLLKELRDELDKRGLLLTAAVTAVEKWASKSYDVRGISSYLDYVNIMGYDMYGAWDHVTGHNAPLHKGEGDEDESQDRVFSVDFALQYWLNQGCPPEKLVLGVPLYGRTFVLADDQIYGVRAPSNGPGLAGPYTQTRGLIGYNELCQKLRVETWDVREDTLAKVPYAVQGRNWVSYDNSDSITAKVEYGLQFGIAGVMAWSIETDDFHGICHGEDFPLLRSINRAIGRNT
ncbi:probable chitinase 2 [Choristoneura fumiferana]|uniref:probable chitinase 2 n=1 Tax=Choristoneura fumiferana TaxID=7141 RepID=UPI003D154FB3